MNIFLTARFRALLSFESVKAVRLSVAEPDAPMIAVAAAGLTRELVYSESGSSDGADLLNYDTSYLEMRACWMEAAEYAKVLDVAVREGRIVDVGSVIERRRAQWRFDAEGLTLAPGFIDTHTHDDTSVVEDARGCCRSFRKV